MGTMLAGFLFLLLLSGGNSSYTPTPGPEQGWNTSSFTETAGFESTTDIPAVTEEIKTCSYQDVLNHLNLVNHSMSRPVTDHNRVTVVHIKMVIYTILDVRESDQTFIPYVWVFMSWSNELIMWEKKQFCGIGRIVIPADLIWKPDITIKEITEKEKTPQSPYISIEHDGWVSFRNDMVLITTCGMQVYKFPFDTQKCSLTFRSIVHSIDEILINANKNAEMNTHWSRQLTESYSEWRVIGVMVKEVDVNIAGFNQSTMVYTISMKRRPVLYIVGFILPVLFFLCLDLASFLISDSGGEKLSFKITVLLAITVMQLILNEILPSSSDRIPLIAVYCIGIFTMMLLSLLETILVMHLLGKDSEDQCHQADEGQGLSEDCTDRQGKGMATKTWAFCVCDNDEQPIQVFPDKEGTSSQLTEMSRSMEKMTSDDLRKTGKTISLFSISSQKEGRKHGYWIRVTKRINKAFFIFYVTTSFLFLIYVFLLWYIAEDE